MNKKRGFVLIFSLIVTMMLSLVLTAFYLQNINESSLARRFADSTQAFWLAEAGLAKLYVNFPASQSGALGPANYVYSAQVGAPSGSYYPVTSTGTVVRSGGKSVARTITASIYYVPSSIPATKFKYGIETTTDLVTKGSVAINPSGSWKEFSTLDFSDLFTVTKAQMQAGATHIYTPATFDGASVDGITWVNVPVGTTLTVAGNLNGSGVLVINGDVHFSGTVDFNGIIYVIGALTMTGTVETHGSVLAESSTTVDTTIKGNVTINYDSDEIVNALGTVASLKGALSKSIVSWKSD